jgi:hypothetical protein
MIQSIEHGTAISRDKQTPLTYTDILVCGLNLYNRLSQILGLEDTGGVVLLKKLWSVQVSGHGYKHSRGGASLRGATILCQHSNLSTLSNCGLEFHTISIETPDKISAWEL